MAGHLCDDIHGIGMKEKQQLALFKQLNGLRVEKEFCDITFQCDGGDVSAHKCVLASAGDFFKVLFVSPISTASSTNVVKFDQFSVETVSLLMDVVYSKVDVAAIHVAELLRLAEYVRLDWLVELLVEKIRHRINEFNVCDWYKIAECCGVVKLKFLCECFIRENINKVQLDELEKFFPCEALNRISLWNDDMNRDVVISADNCFKNLLMFDPTHDSIARLERTGGSGMIEFFSGHGEIHFVSSFLYQNVLYVVTLGWDFEDNENNWTLWKWHHACKSFELIYQLKTGDVKNKLTHECAENVTFLSAIQFYYDHFHCLYVLCLLDFDSFSLPYRYCIFKFDLRTLTFFPGHILVDDEFHNDPCQIAYLKGDKTCLVTPEMIYYIEDHDFDVTGFPADRLFTLELHTYYWEESTFIAEVTWGPWQTVNIEGEFYCLVRSNDSYLILKLDKEQLSWIFCAARTACIDELYHNYDPELRSLFHCGLTVYAHWKEEGDVPQGTIYYLDEKENCLKPVEFSPDCICESILSYIVVPYHTLL